ncbi:hypothetical protein FHG87_017340 [Trinorchestia longiramus]|nr:hypothetical protein FHG87_017340 [Trinorchestia longiramus]
MRSSVVNLMVPIQTSTAKRLAFIDQYANWIEEVNPATKLGPGTTKSTALINQRSLSGSRAQPTAQYKKAATLCVTDSPPSASKVNISIRILIT